MVSYAHHDTDSSDSPTSARARTVGYVEAAQRCVDGGRIDVAVGAQLQLRFDLVTHATLLLVLRL